MQVDFCRGLAQSKLPFRLANPSVEFWPSVRPFLVCYATSDEGVDPAIQCRFRFCQFGLRAVVLFGDIDAKDAPNNNRYKFGMSLGLMV